MATKAKKSAPAAPAGILPVPALPTPSLPSHEDMTAFGRETIAAAAKSNAAFSAGCEAIGHEMMTYSRTAIEQASETARALLSARTFEDVVKVQTDFAQRNFAGLVAGSARLTELGTTLASETIAPWSGRVEDAIAQLTKPLAA